MRNVLRAWSRASLVALAILSACSGSDGSGDSPGTGGTGGTGGGKGGLAITPATVAFSALQNAWVPSSQWVAVTFTASDVAYVVAGYPQGTAQPSWLDMSLTGTGKYWTLELRVTDTALEPGTYTATVRVVIARSDQSIIEQQDAEVTYTVRTGVVASHRSFAFNYVWGSSEKPRPMSFTVDGTPGLPFQATVDQPWVTLGGASGVVATSGAADPVVQMSVDTTDLAIGKHEALVTVAGGDENDTVDVTLNVKAPTLSMHTGAMIFSGIAGKDVDTGGESLLLDTGSNAYPFTASGTEPWLRPSPSSGNVSAAGTHVSLSGDAATLPPGEHTASAQFTATVNGAAVTFAYPVTFRLSAPAISSTPASIALSGATGQPPAAATAQVRVDTGANAFAFSAAPASGGASWLCVSPSSGTISGTPVTISVSADASALAAGTYTSAVELTVDVNGAPVTKSIPVTLTLF